MNKFTTFLCLKDVILFFKQQSSNFATLFTLWFEVNFGARLLSGVTRGLMLFFLTVLWNAKTLSLPVGVAKNIKSGWSAK